MQKLEIKLYTGKRQEYTASVKDFGTFFNHNFSFRKGSIVISTCSHAKIHIKYILGYILPNGMYKNQIDHVYNHHVTTGLKNRIAK